MYLLLSRGEGAGLYYNLQLEYYMMNLKLAETGGQPLTQAYRLLDI